MLMLRKDGRPSERIWKGPALRIIVCSPIVDKLAAMHDLSAFSIVQARGTAFLAKRSLFLLLWGRD